jgi:hypothetical protein
MRIIDANTGTEVTVGQTFRNINGVHRLLAIDEGLLSARAQFESSGQVFWLPLRVRYTHPRFFLQKVAFIPS